MSIVACNRCTRWIDLDWESPIEFQENNETIYIHEECATDEELEEDI